MTCCAFKTITKGILHRYCHVTVVKVHTLMYFELFETYHLNVDKTQAKNETYQICVECRLSHTNLPCNLLIDPMQSHFYTTSAFTYSSIHIPLILWEGLQIRLPTLMQYGFYIWSLRILFMGVFALIRNDCRIW
jgi:hypothetical protein